MKSYAKVEGAILRSGFTISTLVSGTARGADKLGEQWGRKNNVEIERHPAQWNKYGPAAGPIRNREMSEVSDATVLIWGGDSTGSHDMLQNTLRQRNELYVEIDLDAPPSKKKAFDRERTAFVSGLPPSWWRLNSFDAVCIAIILEACYAATRGLGESIDERVLLAADLLHEEMT